MILRSLKLRKLYLLVRYYYFPYRLLCTDLASPEGMTMWDLAWLV